MRCEKSGFAVSIALLLVIFLGLALSAEAEDIDELKTRLKNASYGNYWDRLNAVSSLGKIKNREAASLLVTVLDDEDAPIREAAAMELGGFKDAESVAIMCQAALRARNDTARAYAVWALGMSGQKDAMDAVVRASADQSFQVRLRAVEVIPLLGGGAAAVKALTERLGDNAPAVRAAAIFALAVLRDSSASDVIAREIGDGNWQVHSAAVEATAIVRPEGISKVIGDALKSRDSCVRLAALNAGFNLVIGQPGDLNAKKLFLDTAVTCLGDDDLPVRAGTVRKLVLYRRKECIEPLMNRLGSETGRLRLDIVRALRQLTGKEIGFDARDWKVWWDANKTDFEIAVPKKGEKKSDEPATADGSVATFFDIPILSDRVVFIIDFSGSMKNAEGGAGDKNDTKDEKEAGNTKAAIAIEQLCGALSKFKQDVRFNIIVMNTEATAMKKRSFAENILVPATDGNKNRAKEYIEDMWRRLGELKRGRGDMYDCVAEAFDIPDVDTVLILSDGKPTYGTYVFDDNIYENVTKINKYRNIAIHTVLTGKKGTDKKFMERLAEDNMGIFVQK
jgi:HEAT repeat protein